MAKNSIALHDKIANFSADLRSNQACEVHKGATDKSSKFNHDFTLLFSYDIL
jgi:hypothetical protein